MRYLATAAAFILSLVVVAAVAIGAVLVFAGPHSDLLPRPLQTVVYVAAWASILVLPPLAARATWRRTRVRDTE